jgi:hypothetical protein
MEAVYHVEMMKRALGGRLSPRALAAATRANLGQDSLAGLFRPEFHFDDNLFEKSLSYIEACREAAARSPDPAGAWAAFGRLSHGAQDFYAHSNYVALWADQQTLVPGSGPGPGRLPPPEKIDGLDPALLQHSRLRSGRVYWPTEALWILRPLRPLVKALVPKDSHAWMNLDEPGCGPLFPYAIEAAVQRTQAEFERTLALIGETQGEATMRRFLDPD